MSTIISEQFDCPTDVLDFPFMPASEPVQVCTNAPSQIQVFREISFLKRYKAAKADQLSSTFFIDRVNRIPGTSVGERTAF